MYVQYVVSDYSGQTYANIGFFIAALIYGFSILPSTSIIMEFGIELGAPVLPASCNSIMIIVGEICSVVGVFIYNLFHLAANFWN